MLQRVLYLPLIDLANEIGIPQNELHTLLGIDETELANMTLTEFQDHLAKVEDEEFSRVEELRNIATSRDSSVSERQQARQLLRDAGATGVVAAEENVDSLLQDVEGARTIQFGDETYDAEEFLADESISQLVGEYLSADDEQKTKFTEQFGAEFTNFIESHRSVLEEAADDLDETNTNLSEIQTQNAELANIEGIGTLSDEAAAALIPGFGSFQGEVLEKPAVLDVLSLPSLPPEQKANLFNVLSQASTAVLEEIRELSFEDLKELGALENSRQFQGQVAAWDLLSKVEDFNPENAAEAHELVTAILGGQPLNEAEGALQAASLLGQPLTGTAGLLDSDGDGQIDDPSILKENLTNHLNETNDGIFEPIEAPAEYQSVLDEIGHLLADGDLTSEEILDTIETGDIDTQNAILDAVSLSPEIANSLDPETKQTLVNTLASRYTVGPQALSSLQQGSYWEVDVASLGEELSQVLDSIGKYPWAESALRSKVSELQSVRRNAISRQQDEARLVDNYSDFPFLSRHYQSKLRQGDSPQKALDSVQELATNLMRENNWRYSDVEKHSNDLDIHRISTELNNLKNSNSLTRWFNRDKIKQLEDQLQRIS